MFAPWAILVTIDLASLKSRRAGPFPEDSEVDIRSWDIPLPLQMSSTHSLQATSEGVYMTIEVVPLDGNPQRSAVSAGWVPSDYREHLRKKGSDRADRKISPGADEPEKSFVLALRYSRH